MESPKCEYSVGDKVRIINRPIRMVFGWIDAMNKFCGQTVTIKSIRWEASLNTYGFHFEENRYTWSDDCFYPVETGDEDDFVSDEEFMALLNKEEGVV